MNWMYFYRSTFSIETNYIQPTLIYIYPYIINTFWLYDQFICIWPSSFFNELDLALKNSINIKTIDLLRLKEQKCRIDSTVSYSLYSKLMSKNFLNQDYY
jgi:hypothetical protein